MRGEKGAASMLGVILTMVILVLAAWFLMKNTGFLGGGGGEEAELTPIDQAEAVLDAYRPGCDMEAVVTQEDWVRLTGRRRTPTPQ